MDAEGHIRSAQSVSDQAGTKMSDLNAARFNMVESQVRPSAITDGRVADALHAVPRERFVPAEVAEHAYMDESIEISDGRFLMTPTAFAKLMQAAEIDADALVLDVGCGSGYSTAVLAELAGAVVGLEEDENLASRATGHLTALEVDNAAVVTGKLIEGCALQGPYDVIFVEGAVDEVPSALFDQLAEGGRLAAIIDGSSVGKATIYTRSEGDIGHSNPFDAKIPPLPGFQKPKGFEF